MSWQLQAIKQLAIYLRFFALRVILKQISSVRSNQHFPQGWAKWKVNGREKAGMSITRQIANNAQRKKPDTRVEDFLRLLFLPLLTLGSEDPEYMVAGPWGVPCLPASPGCVEVGWRWWSPPTAALQAPVFRPKQGKVQLLPHLVKIMGFFGIMQVSHGTQSWKAPVWWGVALRFLQSSASYVYNITRVFLPVYALRSALPSSDVISALFSM